MATHADRAPSPEVASGHRPSRSVPEIVRDVVRSPGQPLDAAARASMEPRFGHDFSQVRVHADASAARSARAVNALAYTIGQDIAFGEGHYAPSTREGRRLLAHELTHVTQGEAGLLRQAVEPDEATLDAEEEALEREAYATAEKFVEESTGVADYPQEPGLEGELPHPDEAYLAAIIGEEDASVEAGSVVAEERLADAAPVLLAAVGESVALAGSPAGKSPPRGKTAQAKKTGKRIVVDLAQQTATALENGKPVKTMPISSGKVTHPTTPGHFTITERDRDHTSSKYGKCVSKQGSRSTTTGKAGCAKGERYEGAPMPFFQRFNGPEGFHQGLLPGHPDSHGCVRLGRDNAEWLWNWAKEGSSVDVVPGRPAKPARRKR